MSWSCTFIGTPDNIVKALQKQSEQLTGDSKSEFDHALPALVVLVQQNFNKDNDAPALKLSANGHGYSANGEPKYGTCNVSLENLGGMLV